jgi:hypothetical protein
LVSAVEANHELHDEMRKVKLKIVESKMKKYELEDQIKLRSAQLTEWERRVADVSDHNNNLSCAATISEKQKELDTKLTSLKKL